MLYLISKLAWYLIASFAIGLVVGWVTTDTNTTSNIN